MTFLHLNCLSMVLNVSLFKAFKYGDTKKSEALLAVEIQNIINTHVFSDFDKSVEIINFVFACNFKASHQDGHQETIMQIHRGEHQAKLHLEFQNAETFE